MLLDVRSRNEYSIVSLPSSINIPFASLGEQSERVFTAVAEVIEHRSSKGDAGCCGHVSNKLDQLVPVYVICRRGNDSQLAVNLLRNAGVETALDIVGGLESWAREVDPQFPAY